MGKLYRYTAEPQGAVVAGVRAGSPVSEGSLAPAINQIGQTIDRANDLKFQADYNRASLDDVIETGVARQKFREAFQFEIDVINKTDFSIDDPISQDAPNYFNSLVSLSVKERDKWLADSTRNVVNKIDRIPKAFKTKSAQAKFEAWRIDALDAFNAEVSHAINAKYTDYQLSKIDKLRTDAIELGDLGGADHYVDKMDEMELITSARAVDLKAENKKLFTQTIQVEKDRDMLFDMMNKGEIPSYDTIEGTVLSENEKQRFWENSLQLAKSLKMARYETTDPAVELDLLQKIDLRKPVSVQDIYGKAGRGLSIETAKQLVNRLTARETKKGNDPTDRLLVQQYLNDLEQLSRDHYFASGIDEKGKPIKKDELTEEQRLYNIRAFTAIHRELTDYVKQNPQASDEQITQKYQSLIAPSAAQQALTGWDWWEVGGKDRQEKRNRLFWQGLIDKDPEKVAATENVLNELGLEDSRFITLNPDAEPLSLDEFRLTVASFDDEAAAKKYYEQWVTKFKESE